MMPRRVGRHGGWNDTSKRVTRGSNRSTA